MYGEMVMVWIIAALLFVGMHYFPWEQVLGEVRKPPKTYIMGTLGLGACFSGLLVWWTLYRGIPWIVLVAFWGVAVFGGGTVWGCYILDAYLENQASARDERARAELSARRRQDENK